MADVLTDQDRMADERIAGLEKQLRDLADAHGKQGEVWSIDTRLADSGSNGMNRQKQIMEQIEYWREQKRNRAIGGVYPAALGQDSIGRKKDELRTGDEVTSDLEV